MTTLPTTNEAVEAASAVAVAAVAASAVAASPEDLARLKVSQAFKLNNVALKWIRDSFEHPPGNPVTDYVDLTWLDPLEIGVIENKGPDYDFFTTPWSWRQMLADLNPTAKDFILGSNPL